MGERCPRFEPGGGWKPAPGLEHVAARSDRGRRAVDPLEAGSKADRVRGTRLLLLALVVVVPFLPALGNGFVWDDEENLVGNPYETAVAAAHLVLGGVCERFARIRFCLAHAGGALPMLAGRLQHGYATDRPGIDKTLAPPTEILRRFLVDCIAHDPKALELAAAVVGERHVLFGSDWPFPMGLPDPHAQREKPAVPLGPSRRIVWRLAALFSVDSFAGGLVLNSLLALWLFQRFDMSLAAAGAFFFWTGLLAATSQLLAAPLARRIGLVNTMVFTHIPSSLCLIAAALAPTLPVALGLLLLRSALSQMDVPARSAFVMSVVTPAERPAAASFTAVPRSLAAAVGPSITGALFAAGAMATPLVGCGVLKIAYDLALFAAFRRVEQETALTRGT